MSQPNWECSASSLTACAHEFPRGEGRTLGVEVSARPWKVHTERWRRLPGVDRCLEATVSLRANIEARCRRLLVQSAFLDVDDLGWESVVLRSSWTPVTVATGFKTPTECRRVLEAIGSRPERDRIVDRMDRHFSELPGFERLRIYRDAVAAHPAAA